MPLSPGSTSIKGHDLGQRAQPLCATVAFSAKWDHEPGTPQGRWESAMRWHKSGFNPRQTHVLTVTFTQAQSGEPVIGTEPKVRPSYQQVWPALATWTLKLIQGLGERPVGRKLQTGVWSWGENLPHLGSWSVVCGSDHRFSQGWWCSLIGREVLPACVNSSIISGSTEGVRMLSISLERTESHANTGNNGQFWEHLSSSSHSPPRLPLPKALEQKKQE